MQSSGGLTDAHAFQGKDSILSGPAGGIVGMAEVARLAGFDRVIGFDMGGTSTDVSHFAGEYERAFETLVAGVRMRAPMMSIHTVAAGGGSKLQFDGARLRVGPDSAGANPGPACYRRGGPLTVTDANLMLGRIQPEWFPRVFGPDADQPLDAEVVRERFARLAAEVERATGRPIEPESLAQGFIDIAVANMANAIKKISVQRGYDITRYALVTFGGAGGQHACLVADALAIPTVLAHPLAGVLSAYGMGLARTRALRERSIEVRLDESGLATAREVAAELVSAARADLVAQGEPADGISVIERAMLRYDGTDTGLAVALSDAASMRAAFDARYRERFSFLLGSRPLVIESVLIEAQGPEPTAAVPIDGIPATGVASAGTASAGAASAGSSSTGTSSAGTASAGLEPVARRPLFSGGQWVEAGWYRREQLPDGARITGPAVIAEANATTVVDAGWAAELTPIGDLVLGRAVPRPKRHALGTEADPVMLEIFNNLFMSIAEQMGYRLQNTAHSVNIKERLDFSCAVFDADGLLVANAPHMPVHLGSMGASVRAVIDSNQRSDPAGRRLRPQRSVRRRHPPAGRDGDHPGVRRRRQRNPVLRRIARPPCRHRRAHAGFDATRQPHHRRRGRADHQLPAGARRRDPRTGAARGAGRRPLSGALRRPDPGRPAGADRGQREGPRGTAADGRLFRPRRGSRLHGSRPGQRRGVGATRDRGTEGRSATNWRSTTAPGSGSR